MAEFTLGFLFNNLNKFSTCKACEIINLTENERCWNCKMPNFAGNFIDVREGDLHQLRKFEWNMLMVF